MNGWQNIWWHWKTCQFKLPGWEGLRGSLPTSQRHFLPCYWWERDRYIPSAALNFLGPFKYILLSDISDYLSQVFQTLPWYCHSSTRNLVFTQFKRNRTYKVRLMSQSPNLTNPSLTSLPDLGARTMKFKSFCLMSLCLLTFSKLRFLTCSEHHKQSSSTFVPPFPGCKCGF